MRKTAPWHDVDYLYDSTGRITLLGERVAYNLGGRVAIGRVERIRVQAWKEPVKALLAHGTHYRIMVKYEKGNRGFKRGHLSIVTDNSNLVTLEHYTLGEDE